MSDDWNSRDSSLSGMTVYQELVKSNIQRVLEGCFPVVSQVLAGPEWREVVHEYFLLFPEARYETDHVGSDFPAFLTEHLARGTLPITLFHVELAELEWNLRTVACEPDLIQIHQPGPRAVLNPTLVILEVHYPVVSFWDQWLLDEGFRESFTVPESWEEPRFVFLFRTPEGMAVAHDGTDELLFTFKVVLDGLSLIEAAALGEITPEDVRELIRRGIRLGLILPPAS